MSGPNQNSFPWSYDSTRQPQTTNNQHTNSFCPGPYTTNFTTTTSNTATSTSFPTSYPQTPSAPTYGTNTQHIQPYAIDQAYNVSYAAGRHNAISGSSSTTAVPRDQYGWEAEYATKHGEGAARNTGFDGASGGNRSAQGYEAGVYVTVIPQGEQSNQGLYGAQGYQSGFGRGWGTWQR